MYICVCLHIYHQNNMAVLSVYNRKCCKREINAGTKQWVRQPVAQARKFSPEL